MNEEAADPPQGASTAGPDRPVERPDERAGEQPVPSEQKKPPDRSERPEQPKPPERSEQPEQPKPPEQPEQPERTKPPDAADVSAAPGAPAAPGEDDASPGEVHYNNVNQYFYGELTAAAGTFGIGTASAAPGRAARRRAVGRLDAQEADAILAPYVRPPGCFAAAVDALETDGVVVLVAPHGSGKRSGAVALVAEVAERTGYVVLSPGRSLDDLAGGKVAFEKGVGYVLIDRMNETSAQTADFDWRRVRDTVREHGAHLVVTTVHGDDAARVESVRHVTWRPPDLAAALRLRLVRAGCTGDVVDTAVAGLPDGCRIGEVAAAAERIAAGAEPDAVWREYGSRAAQPVRDWFAEPRTPQEWAEITTLAFVYGADYRGFETCQERLERRVEGAFATPRTEEERAAAAARAADRRLALTENTLVTVDRRKHGALTRTALVFPFPQYRQWVLEELWNRRSTPYWNGVRDWLTDLVAEQPGLDLQLSVAQGLALLALPAFDEVVGNYLYPWAAGEAGRAGQSTATLVLQCMCLDESLAATALGVARDWARSADPVLRSSGAAAFSGALGVRFPSDAVTMLLRLVLRRGEGALALAGLVAVLAECGEDTGAVFRALAQQVRAQRDTLTGPHKRNTLGAVLTVLRARDTRTGRLVCAVLLDRDPRQTDRIGRLWAAVLDHRPRRGVALAGLYATLRELPPVSERPAEVAERFGGALGRVLPEEERTRLCEELRHLTASADAAVAALIDTFLTAVLSTED
ncbi:hypothetical protein [Streptomyces sp. bgisy154]|uniref:hypothetical protein n=1 Tax=Streptomyces sp. bgisy154 TaxID=3413794 RepID=UPI003D7639C6